MIKYATKFLQLLRFSIYLIPYEEKKVKKFERGLNSHIGSLSAILTFRISPS